MSFMERASTSFERFRNGPLVRRTTLRHLSETAPLSLRTQRVTFRYYFPVDGEYEFQMVRSLLQAFLNFGNSLANFVNDGIRSAAKERYVRLVEVTNVEWQARAQFFAMAAQMMRRILVDAARSRGSH